MNFSKSRMLIALALTACLTLSGGAYLTAQDEAPGRGESELKIGASTVKISFGRPDSEGNNYKRMQTFMKEGYVWRMGKNQVTKLSSDTDLMFGDVKIPAGDHALWAKRVKDSWHLLFHPAAGAWGFPSPKEGFTAEVPMKSAKADEAERYLKIDLKKDGDGGKLMLVWGDNIGSVNFKAAE